MGFLTPLTIHNDFTATCLHQITDMDIASFQKSLWGYPPHSLRPTHWSTIINAFVHEEGNFTFYSTEEAALGQDLGVRTPQSLIQSRK